MKYFAVILISLVINNLGAQVLTEKDTLTVDSLISNSTKIELVKINNNGHSLINHKKFSLEDSLYYDIDNISIDTFGIEKTIALKLSEHRAVKPLLFHTNNINIVHICYKPGYGIVFYNNDKMIAYVEFCGKCNQIRKVGDLNFLPEVITERQSKLFLNYFKEYFD